VSLFVLKTLVFDTLISRFHIVDIIGAFPMDFAGVFDTRKKMKTPQVEKLELWLKLL